MKYDDMGYKNAYWRSDKALISEAYEDLYKVYADRNQKLQEGRSSEALEKKAAERKDNQEIADRKSAAQQRRNDTDPQELPHEYQSTHPVSKKLREGTKGTKAERKDVDKNDDGKLSKEEKDEANKERHDEGRPHLCATKVEHRVYGLGECIYAEHAQPDSTGYVSWYNVKFNNGIRTVNTQDLNVLSESNHGEMKESISGNPRTAHTDEENEEYDREEERKAKQKKAKEKKAKEDKWNEVGQAISRAPYDDEFSLGAFEESQREMTINELWALCGTGEEVWNESGVPTNELKARVGDTVYFTWNYRPDDPNSCRTLRNAKII